MINDGISYAEFVAQRTFGTQARGISTAAGLFDDAAATISDIENHAPNGGPFCTTGVSANVVCTSFLSRQASEQLVLVTAVDGPQFGRAIPLHRALKELVKMESRSSELLWATTRQLLRSSVMRGLGLGC